MASKVCAAIVVVIYLTLGAIIYNLLTPDTNWERMLFNEIAQMCFQLELKCHGSSIYFLRAFGLFAKEYTKQEDLRYQILVEDNQVENEKYLNNLLRSCFPAKQEDIDCLIQKIYITKMKIS